MRTRLLLLPAMQNTKRSEQYSSSFETEAEKKIRYKSINTVYLTNFLSAIGEPRKQLSFYGRDSCVGQTPSCTHARTHTRTHTRLQRTCARTLPFSRRWFACTRPAPAHAYAHSTRLFLAHYATQRHSACTYLHLLCTRAPACLGVRVPGMLQTPTVGLQNASAACGRDRTVSLTHVRAPSLVLSAPLFNIHITPTMHAHTSAGFSILMNSVWPFLQSIGGDEPFLGYVVGAFSLGQLIGTSALIAWQDIAHTHTLSLSLSLSHTHTERERERETHTHTHTHTHIHTHTHTARAHHTAPRQIAPYCTHPGAAV